MLMTLVIIKQGKRIVWTSVHSNWHYLKIIKNISDHFRYDFVGCDVGRKNDIALKQLTKKIDKLVEPYEIWKWKRFNNLREIAFMDNFDNWILVELASKRISGNKIWMNISTEVREEKELKMVYDELKKLIKSWGECYGKRNKED